MSVKPHRGDSGLGETFAPERVHSGSLSWLYNCLHDITTKCHTGASHPGVREFTQPAIMLSPFISVICFREEGMIHFVYRSPAKKPESGLYSDWIGNNTDDLCCSDWPKCRHPLVVVDFSLHFCLHTSSEYAGKLVMKFLPAQHSWKCEECLNRNFLHWNIFHLIVYLIKSCSQSLTDHLNAISDTDTEKKKDTKNKTYKRRLCRLYVTFILCDTSSQAFERNSQTIRVGWALELTLTLLVNPHNT